MNNKEMLNLTDNVNPNVSSMAITRPITENRNLLVILSLTAALATAFTILSNMTVVTAMVSSYIRHPAVSTGNGRSNNGIAQILMTSMAVADALVGAVIMPLATSEIVNNGQWALSPKLCHYRALLDILLCTVSIYHVLCMAVDRYLAECWPLVYHKLTCKTGVSMVIICWIFPNAFFASSVVLGWAHSDVSRRTATISVNFFCMTTFTTTFNIIGSCLAFLAPFSMVFILYILILVQVRTFQRGRIKRLQGNVRSAVTEADPATDLKLDMVNNIDNIMCLPEITSCSNNMVCEISGLKIDNVSLDMKVLNLREMQIPTSGICTHMVKYDETANKKSDSRFCTHKVFSIHQSMYKCCSRTKPYTNEIMKNSKHNVSENQGNKRCGFLNKSSASKSYGLKAYRTIGLIVFVFMVCWLPFAVFQSVISGLPGLDIQTWMMTSLSWLGYLNSAFNPLLFCCHRSVRSSVKRLICFAV